MQSIRYRRIALNSGEKGEFNLVTLQKKDIEFFQQNTL